MHKAEDNLILINNKIKKEIKNYNTLPKVIAISKTFSLDYINPLIKAGHIHFGENKVQEAEKKWKFTKEQNPNIKLHMVGKLQTNKVKSALEIFDFLHSLDTLKLAESISKHSDGKKNKIKIFVQVNIGNEPQKNGIKISDVSEFVENCKKNFSLDIIGLMCIPPFNNDPKTFFSKMQELKKELNLNDLSMGMSSDYLVAINYGSSFLRLGTAIFGKRQ
tara:strand:- start:4 stop:660 length:657 start_codon:yes stop_codon:yes gene_type:complete